MVGRRSDRPAAGAVATGADLRDAASNGPAAVHVRPGDSRGGPRRSPGPGAGGGRAPSRPAAGEPRRYVGVRAGGPAGRRRRARRTGVPARSGPRQLAEGGRPGAWHRLVSRHVRPRSVSGDRPSGLRLSADPRCGRGLPRRPADRADGGVPSGLRQGNRHRADLRAPPVEERDSRSPHPRGEGLQRRPTGRRNDRSAAHRLRLERLPRPGLPRSSPGVPGGGVRGTRPLLALLLPARSGAGRFPLLLPHDDRNGRLHRLLALLLGHLRAPAHVPVPRRACRDVRRTRHDSPPVPEVLRAAGREGPRRPPLRSGRRNGGVPPVAPRRRPLLPSPGGPRPRGDRRRRRRPPPRHRGPTARPPLTPRPRRNAPDRCGRRLRRNERPRTGNRAPRSTSPCRARPASS